MCKCAQNNAWHVVSTVYELLATILPVAANVFPGLGTPMGAASFAFRCLTPQPGRPKPWPCLSCRIGQSADAFDCGARGTV